MLFILLSWLYILTISSVIGVSFNRLVKIQKQHPVITLFTGFFGITLLAGCYAIWLPLDEYFQFALIIFTTILFYLNNLYIKDYVVLNKQYIKDLNIFNRILLTSIFVLVLAQCASPPFILDNESYYIQTIKWLNEYGFVKGLVNLHLFLGQTSGWHILQSAFSFSFVYDRFNDLSGLALLLGNFYAISSLNQYLINQEKSKINLAVGLFPIFNIFFFQFISAPSPDIAIYVLCLIVFHHFILCFKTYNTNSFLTILILALFMVYIKPTAIPFLVLPLILYKRYYIFTRKIRLHISSLSLITVLLIVVKNWIITGNPIFPINFFDSLNSSWSLPNNVQSYFSLYGKAFAYQMSVDNFETSSWILRLKYWFFASGLHGYFNKAITGLYIIMPVILYKFYNKKAYWIIYVIALISFISLLFIAPQYRFYFPYFMIFSLLILALLIKNNKRIQVLLAFSTLLVLVPLLFEINNQILTTNANHNTTSQFKLDYIIEPYDNSKYPNTFKTIQVEDLEVNVPSNIDFFWSTGNVPIPALNQQQLDYFKTHFNIIPQKRTDNFKDGFYSKKID